MNSDVNDLDLNDARRPAGRRRDRPAGDDADQAVDERDELRDRLLRKTAEFDNFRKRVERDGASWPNGPPPSVLNDVLPVVDDFERALAVEAPPRRESYRPASS